MTAEKPSIFLGRAGPSLPPSRKSASADRALGGAAKLRTFDGVDF